MNLYVMLNYEMFEIPCEKYYKPIICLELRPYNLKCLEENTITILMRNPRVNIDLFSSVFHFFFDGTQDGDYLGHVRSDSTLIYNLDEPQEHFNSSVILLSQGYYLVELIIYIPPARRPFYLREIEYWKHQKEEGECPICFEEKTLVNLHNNEFRHHVCGQCILQLTSCPICRCRL